MLKFYSDDSGFRRYMSKVKKYKKKLSHEEENELIRRFKENKDQEALKQLVLPYIGLVIKLAYKYKRKRVDFSDIVQVGTVGLLEAVNKADPNSEYRFITLAYKFVLRNIWNFVYKNASIVRPKFVAGKVFTGRNDMSLSDFEGYEYAMTMKASQEDYMIKKENLLAILDAKERIVKNLKGRDKVIAEERIFSDDPISLQEIGNRYGTSRERARQVEERIINKFKNIIV